MAILVDHIENRLVRRLEYLLVERLGQDVGGATIYHKDGFFADDEGKVVVVAAVLVGRRLGRADGGPDPGGDFYRLGIKRRAGILVRALAGAQRQGCEQ